MSKYFIGVYTNACKDYCDQTFFNQLAEITRRQDAIVSIVDNTDQLKDQYYVRLQQLILYLAPSQWRLSQVAVAPSDHQFHNNVVESVSALRDQFLTGDADYFLIIESDVIPPADLLDRLDKSIAQLPEDWGILGCLYYDGFHDYTKTGIQQTHHALSGCTVYRREVIERYPFRISEENWGAFPDAWICYDVNKDGHYKIFNDHDIRCEHLHADNGTRQSKPI